VTFMKRFKVVWGLCLAALSLLSVFALGTGSASAQGLLLLPLSHTFPYHLLGLLVKEGKLESVGGKVITSSAVHVLVLALNPTLFHIHLLFLGANTAGAEGCSNTGNAQGILLSMLGHLGLAHHPGGGIRHAVLLLIPSGFSFVCTALGGLVKETVEVKGSVIGELNKPAAGVESEELGISFKQKAGVQLFTSFLLTGSELMTNMFLESKVGNGAFEQAAQEEPEVVLKPLPSQGRFVLILHP
jgi:hypothetical protein